MKCPHCNKLVNASNMPNISKAERNAECYGPSFFTFQCPHCKKKFSTYAEVSVKFNTPYVVDDDKETSY